jgi:hypothetical protein
MKLLTNSICSSIAALLLYSFTAPLHAQEKCGAGTDLMVQALERVRPDSPQNTIRDAVELLKHATNECPNLGDAWYYRSALERKIGNNRLADYSLEKARQVGSDAMQQKLDPFTLAAPPTAAPPGPVREKWALVVGISKFQDAGIPPLTYTTADASAFSKLLTNPTFGRFKPDHVHILTDSQATTSAIKQDLNWLARNAAPDDLVVIYISTHGSSRDMDTREVNYVITYDTQVTSHSAQHDYHDLLYATALPMIDVANEVSNRVQARRVAIFLDTCFSGAAMDKPSNARLRYTSISADTINRMSQGSGRVIITASTADQESLEDSGLAHGYFTYYLIQGLQQDQGMDPISKVFPYVRDQVANRAKAHDREQTPVMGVSDQGAQIIVGVAPSAGAAGGS